MTTEIHESGYVDDNVDYSEKAENQGIVHRQHGAKDVRDRFKSRSNSDIELNAYHKYDRNHDEASSSHCRDLRLSVRDLSWTPLPDYVQIPLPGEKRIDERCKVKFNLGDTSQNIVKGELPRRKAYTNLKELDDLSKVGFKKSFEDLCHQTIKAKKDRYHNLKGYGTGSSGSSSGYSTSTGSSGSSSGYSTGSSGNSSASRRIALYERRKGQSLFVERKAMQTVIDKYKDLMPPELQVEYYDVMILYSDEDREAAEEYKRHLTEDVVLDGEHRVKAVLYDDLEMVSLAGSRFKRFENSFQRCIFTFILLTKAFCECEWYAFSNERCLMQAIYIPQKKWSVVPVYTVQRNKVDFEIPKVLNSLKGVKYYRHDQFYYRDLRRLIANKLHIRIIHERNQIEKQYTWACGQRGKQEILKSKSKPPIGTRKQEHEEEYYSDPGTTSTSVFRGIKHRLKKKWLYERKHVRGVKESHSASQKTDDDHRNLSVKGTDLGESFVSNEFADIRPLDLEQSNDSDNSVETLLPHYRTSRSTHFKMADAFEFYDSRLIHELMQLDPLEISPYLSIKKKLLLKDITDEFKKQFSSEFTIQIFSSKEENIVHFINKENEGIGIMNVQPHSFFGIPVLTINQGLDSDENVRINEYLFRNHRTCSCVELEQIDNIINQHLDSLFANHRNLQSVSSSCIKSYDKEKRIAMIPCIVLYCSLKGYIPLDEETFPEYIEDIPTDVREGYAFATGPGDVNNPLGLGCSIGALGRGESGSLGVFTQNGSSETGFISCAHVFFSYTDLKRNVEQNRREILIETETEIKVRQPGGSVHDHSTDTVCGRVRSGWYGNIRVTDPFTKEELDVTVDLATVQLTDRAPSRHLVQPEIDRNLRDLSGLSDWPNYNFSCCQMELDDLERHVYKCGAKTHLTKGSIKMIGSTYKKGNYRDPRSPIHLKNQFEIQSCHIAETQTASSLPGVQEPFISPGDSGSVVFIKKNGENIHPIGLATGVLLSKLCGRTVPIKCFATPFFAVEAALRKIEPGSMIQNFQKRRELDLPIQTLTDNFQRLTTQQIPANTNRQVTA